MIEQDFVLHGWHVEVAGGRITRGRQTIHLEPQVMKVLAFLACHHNEVVGKSHLINSVWGHSFVGDAALTRCIFEIRQAFGDNAKEPHIVETVPKMGYRLVATLRPLQKKRQFAQPILLRPTIAIALCSFFLIWSTQIVESDARHDNEMRFPGSNAAALDAYQKGIKRYEKYTFLENENAIALFEKALDYDPSFGLAYARLSDSLTRQIRHWGGTRLLDARAAASKALELAPMQPQSHNAYGVVLELSGHGSDALESYERAYTLDRTHWQSAYNAAALHKIRLEFEDAKALFLQALEYSPEHVVAMGHLGFLYLRMGEINKAKQWLARALELAPLDGYAWSQMAALEMVTGNTTEAIKNCQKVRDYFPNHRACLHVLGTSNLLDGNMTEAGKWFDYAITTFTDSEYSQLGKAQIFLANGENQKGMGIVNQVLEKAYRDAPESDSPWGEYWLIAACYALQGDDVNAFIWLDKAAEGGRRFYLWDSTDPVFTSLHGDENFDRYVAMTMSANP